MRVTVKCIGDLRDYFGKTSREIELPENACVRDLYSRIDQIWGTALPAYMWDPEQRRFRGPVYLVVNQKVVQDPDSPLRDGMEIRVMRAIAGG